MEDEGEESNKFNFNMRFKKDNFELHQSFRAQPKDEKLESDVSAVININEQTDSKLEFKINNEKQINLEYH